MSLIISSSLRQQHWLKLSPMPSSLLPRKFSSWLLDKGSLTLRLKNLAPGSFSVKLLYTGFARASVSEASALNINFREQVYIREVALCIGNKPYVFARSVIPRSTLTGIERQLLWLREKPLGEFLFTHKNMSRGAIEVKQGEVNTRTSWARRSIFTVNNKPLLVSEYFLPELLVIK
jgi:chorismate--pyruvate lyase